MQSLIREVAYGTLARRDRRARHLAVARHYEARGDDELAGALASHYLAAHEASDPGPEADAISAQARLALSGAAERAASLGGYDQALAYLDQALAISTDPAERAPLLDRAAAAAGVAARASVPYAEGAIDAYRQLDNPVAALAATGRLGRLLIESGEMNRAAEVLETALTEADSIADEATKAGILVSRARVHMRLGRSTRGRSGQRTVRSRLPSGWTLTRWSRKRSRPRGRRSAISAVAARQSHCKKPHSPSAVKLPDRSFEMRARNNLSAVLGDDEPVRSTQLALDGAEMARELGHRGMYHWLIAHLTFGVRAEGSGWDAQIERLREALESATVRSDRMRLRSYLSVLESSRGEGLETIGPELTEMLGDSVDPDDQFAVFMGTAYAALLSGDTDTAYSLATEAQGLATQSPEGQAGSHFAPRSGVATMCGCEPRARRWSRGHRPAPSTGRGARRRPR